MAKVPPAFAAYAKKAGKKSAGNLAVKNHVKKQHVAHNAGM